MLIMNAPPTTYLVLVYICFRCFGKVLWDAKVVENISLSSHVLQTPNMYIITLNESIQSRNPSLKLSVYTQYRLSHSTLFPANLLFSPFLFPPFPLTIHPLLQASDADYLKATKIFLSHIRGLCLRWVTMMWSLVSA